MTVANQTELGRFLYQCATDTEEILYVDGFSTARETVINEFAKNDLTKHLTRETVSLKLDEAEGGGAEAFTKAVMSFME